MRKIYHYYGKARALEEINLTIEEGALDAVIGPNGAGKSTLLRVISGLEEPDRGKIEFLGERIDEMSAHKIAKRGIAHCPERRRLFYDMTVMENIEMGAYSLKDKSKFKELLEFVFELFPRLRERRKQRAGRTAIHQIVHTLLLESVRCRRTSEEQNLRKGRDHRG